MQVSRHSVINALRVAAEVYAIDGANSTVASLEAQFARQAAECESLANALERGEEIRFSD